MTEEVRRGIPEPSRVQGQPGGGLFGLAGKRALVTGGGSGLGLQVAAGLAEAGADLMLCARKPQRCEEAAARLADEYGVRAVARRCDITEADDRAALVAACVADLGGIDILVNNAGTSWGAPALELPERAWRKVIEVNLTSTFLLTQEVARRFVEQGGGTVINIASVLGLRGAPPAFVDAVPYNASKGGVIAMTRDLAVKWAPLGVRVNAIAPGWFPTEMSDDVLARDREMFLARIPAARFGGSEDLKGVAVFLASEASAYVVGQTLVVDGGQSVS